MKRHNDYLSVYGVKLNIINHCEEASFDMELVLYIYLYREREIIRVA